MGIQFLPGVYFTPTDRDLIEFYLKPKVLGQNLVFDVIRNKQVYGPHSNPWDVFDINDHDSWFDSPVKETEKVTFVFTNLSKIASSNITSTSTNHGTKRRNDKVRVVRTRGNTSKKAGCGTWVTKSTPDPIQDRDGNVIGVRRYLVFEINDIDSAAAAVGESRCGGYRMHEYSLSGVNECFDLARTLVLCKITYESSKNLNGLQIADHVLRSSNNCGKGKQEEGQNNNFEGIGTSTLTVMNPEGSVGDNTVCAQHINEFGDDLYCENLCFHEDWIAEIMNSTTELQSWFQTPPLSPTLAKGNLK